MKHSQSQAAISDALSKAQAVMEGAKKDASNPFFKTRYADLTSCWEACKGALTANGIAVIQGSVPSEHGVQIQTRLTHKSGEWIEDDGLFVPATKADAQGFGSAMTYARRYGLCAMVGIAPEDDDGNAAAKTAPKRQEYPKETGNLAAAITASASDPARDKLYARLQETAISGGLEALKEAWMALTKLEQKMIGPEGLEALKKEASK